MGFSLASIVWRVIMVSLKFFIRHGLFIPYFAASILFSVVDEMATAFVLRRVLIEIAIGCANRGRRGNLEGRGDGGVTEVYPRDPLAGYDWTLRRVAA